VVLCILILALPNMSPREARLVQRQLSAELTRVDPASLLSLTALETLVMTVLHLLRGEILTQMAGTPSGRLAKFRFHGSQRALLRTAFRSLYLTLPGQGPFQSAYREVASDPGALEDLIGRVFIGNVLGLERLRLSVGDNNTRLILAKYFLTESRRIMWAPILFDSSVARWRRGGPPARPAQAEGLVELSPDDVRLAFLWALEGPDDELPRSAVRARPTAKRFPRTRIKSPTIGSFYCLLLYTCRFYSRALLDGFLISPTHMYLSAFYNSFRRYLDAFSQRYKDVHSYLQANYQRYRLGGTELLFQLQNLLPYGYESFSEFLENHAVFDYRRKPAPGGLLALADTAERSGRGADDSSAPFHLTMAEFPCECPFTFSPSHEEMLMAYFRVMQFFISSARQQRNFIWLTDLLTHIFYLLKHAVLPFEIDMVATMLLHLFDSISLDLLPDFVIWTFLHQVSESLDGFAVLANYELGRKAPTGALGKGLKRGFVAARAHCYERFMNKVPRISHRFPRGAVRNPILDAFGQGPGSEADLNLLVIEGVPCFADSWVLLTTRRFASVFSAILLRLIPALRPEQNIRVLYLLAYLSLSAVDVSVCRFLAGQVAQAYCRIEAMALGAGAGWLAARTPQEAGSTGGEPAGCTSSSCWRQRIPPRSSLHDAREAIEDLFAVICKNTYQLDVRSAILATSLARVLYRQNTLSRPIRPPFSGCAHMLVGPSASRGSGGDSAIVASPIQFLTVQLTILLGEGGGGVDNGKSGPLHVFTATLPAVDPHRTTLADLLSGLLSYYAERAALPPTSAPTPMAIASRRAGRFPEHAWSGGTGGSGGSGGSAASGALTGPIPAGPRTHTARRESQREARRETQREAQLDMLRNFLASRDLVFLVNESIFSITPQDLLCRFLPEYSSGPGGPGEPSGPNGSAPRGGGMDIEGAPQRQAAEASLSPPTMSLRAFRVPMVQSPMPPLSLYRNIFATLNLPVSASSFDYWSLLAALPISRTQCSGFLGLLESRAIIPRRMYSQALYYLVFYLLEARTGGMEDGGHPASADGATPTGPGLNRLSKQLPAIFFMLCSLIGGEALSADSRPKTTQDRLLCTAMVTQYLNTFLGFVEGTVLSPGAAALVRGEEPEPSAIEVDATATRDHPESAPALDRLFRLVRASAAESGRTACDYAPVLSGAVSPFSAMFQAGILATAQTGGVTFSPPRSGSAGPRQAAAPDREAEARLEDCKLAIVKAALALLSGLLGSLASSIGEEVMVHTIRCSLMLVASCPSLLYTVETGKLTVDGLDYLAAILRPGESFTPTNEILFFLLSYGRYLAGAPGGDASGPFFNQIGLVLYSLVANGRGDLSVVRNVLFILSYVYPMLSPIRLGGILSYLRSGILERAVHHGDLQVLNAALFLTQYMRSRPGPPLLAAGATAPTEGDSRSEDAFAGSGNSEPQMNTARPAGSVCSMSDYIFQEYPGFSSRHQLDLAYYHLTKFDADLEFWRRFSKCYNMVKALYLDYGVLSFDISHILPLRDVPGLRDGGARTTVLETTRSVGGSPGRTLGASDDAWKGNFLLSGPSLGGREWQRVPAFRTIMQNSIACATCALCSLFVHHPSLSRKLSVIDKTAIHLRQPPDNRFARLRLRDFAEIRQILAGPEERGNRGVAGIPASPLSTRFSNASDTVALDLSERPGNRWDDWEGWGHSRLGGQVGPAALYFQRLGARIRASLTVRQAALLDDSLRSSDSTLDFLVKELINLGAIARYGNVDELYVDHLALCLEDLGIGRVREAVSRFGGGLNHGAETSEDGDSGASEPGLAFSAPERVSGPPQSAQRLAGQPATVADCIKFFGAYMTEVWSLNSEALREARDFPAAMASCLSVHRLPSLSALEPSMFFTTGPVPSFFVEITDPASFSPAELFWYRDHRLDIGGSSYFYSLGLVVYCQRTESGGPPSEETPLDGLTGEPELEFLPDRLTDEKAPGKTQLQEQPPYSCSIGSPAHGFSFAVCEDSEIPLLSRQRSIFHDLDQNEARSSATQLLLLVRLQRGEPWKFSLVEEDLVQHERDRSRQYFGSLLFDPRMLSFLIRSAYEGAQTHVRQSPEASPVLLESIVGRTTGESRPEKPAKRSALSLAFSGDAEESNASDNPQRLGGEAPSVGLLQRRHSAKKLVLDAAQQSSSDGPETDLSEACPEASGPYFKLQAPQPGFDPYSSLSDYWGYATAIVSANSERILKNLQSIAPSDQSQEAADAVTRWPTPIFKIELYTRAFVIALLRGDLRCGCLIGALLCLLANEQRPSAGSTQLAGDSTIDTLGNVTTGNVTTGNSTSDEHTGKFVRSLLWKELQDFLGALEFGRDDELQLLCLVLSSSGHWDSECFSDRELGSCLVRILVRGKQFHSLSLLLESCSLGTAFCKWKCVTYKEAKSVLVGGRPEDAFWTIGKKLDTFFGVSLALGSSGDELGKAKLENYLVEAYSSALLALDGDADLASVLDGGEATRGEAAIEEFLRDNILVLVSIRAPDPSSARKLFAACVCGKFSDAVAEKATSILLSQLLASSNSAEALAALTPVVEACGGCPGFRSQLRHFTASLAESDTSLELLMFLASALRALHVEGEPPDPGCESAFFSSEFGMKQFNAIRNGPCPEEIARTIADRIANSLRSSSDIRRFLGPEAIACIASRGESSVQFLARVLALSPAENNQDGVSYTRQVCEVALILKHGAWNETPTDSLLQLVPNIVALARRTEELDLSEYCGVLEVLRTTENNVLPTISSVDEGGIIFLRMISEFFVQVIPPNGYLQDGAPSLVEALVEVFPTQSITQIGSNSHPFGTSVDHEADPAEQAKTAFLRAFASIVFYSTTRETIVPILRALAKLGCSVDWVISNCAAVAFARLYTEGYGSSEAVLSLGSPLTLEYLRIGLKSAVSRLRVILRRATEAEQADRENHRGRDSAANAAGTRISMSIVIPPTAFSRKIGRQGLGQAAAGRPEPDSLPGEGSEPPLHPDGKPIVTHDLETLLELDLVFITVLAHQFGALSENLPERYVSVAKKAFKLLVTKLAECSSYFSLPCAALACRVLLALQQAGVDVEVAGSMLLGRLDSFPPLPELARGWAEVSTLPPTLPVDPEWPAQEESRRGMGEEFSSLSLLVVQNLFENSVVMPARPALLTTLGYLALEEYGLGCARCALTADMLARTLTRALALIGLAEKGSGAHKAGEVPQLEAPEIPAVQRGLLDLYNIVETASAALMESLTDNDSVQPSQDTLDELERLYRRLGSCPDVLVHEVRLSHIIEPVRARLSGVLRH